MTRSDCASAATPITSEGWRVVIAAMLRAMLGKEFVQHVQPKIGRTQHAAIGKWPLHKEGQPDEIVEAAAEFLQIRLDVGENGAPLRRCIAGRAASLADRIIIVDGRRVSGK